MLH
ncbi:hypothetical protein N499_0812A, partial [Wolbachia pipientis wVitA]|jgi:hypothetical protein